MVEWMQCMYALYTFTNRTHNQVTWARQERRTNFVTSDSTRNFVRMSAGLQIKGVPPTRPGFQQRRCHYGSLQHIGVLSIRLLPKVSLWAAAEVR